MIYAKNSEETRHLRCVRSSLVYNYLQFTLLQCYPLGLIVHSATPSGWCRPAASDKVLHFAVQSQTSFFVAKQWHAFRELFVRSATNNYLHDQQLFVW